MARITVEDCIDKFPCRFELVLVAALRAKKLYSGESPTVEKDNDKNTVIALREIANVTIPIEEMKENLIRDFQTVTLNDEEDENIEIDSANENKEQLEVPISDSYKQIEEEIKELSSSSDSDIKELYETSEDLQTEDIQSSEDTSSSENDEKKIIT